MNNAIWCLVLVVLACVGCGRSQQEEIKPSVKTQERKSMAQEIAEQIDCEDRQAAAQRKWGEEYCKQLCARHPDNPKCHLASMCPQSQPLSAVATPVEAPEPATQVELAGEVSQEDIYEEAPYPIRFKLVLEWVEKNRPSKKTVLTAYINEQEHQKLLNGSGFMTTFELLSKLDGFREYGLAAETVPDLQQSLQDQIDILARHVGTLEEEHVRLKKATAKFRKEIKKN